MLELQKRRADKMIMDKIREEDRQKMEAYWRKKKDEEMQRLSAHKERQAELQAFREAERLKYIWLLCDHCKHSFKHETANLDPLNIPCPNCNNLVSLTPAYIRH